MRPIRALPVLILLAATGCNLKIDPAAIQAIAGKVTPSAKPAGTSPVISDRPAPVDATKLGNVEGFVYGQAGKRQPLPLAEVRAGDVKALAGNPDSSKAVEEDQEFADPANANRDNFDVMHDFNDGAGAVVTQRILRKNVPAPDPTADDATKARVKYVYLRVGEFFLEGLPAGDATLVAKFGTRESQPNPVTIYGNQLVTDVHMAIAIPEPVVVDSGAIPKVVEWVGTKPDTGITVAVSTKVTQTDAGSQSNTTLTYTPDPPVAELSLAAPPGSGGAVIKGYDLLYVYNTPARQAAGKPPVQIGPTRFPISALTVPPASLVDFGPSVTLRIPIGSADLRSAFVAADPADQPGVIQANVELLDGAGFAIQDKSFQNLQVSVPIRSL